MPLYLRANFLMLAYGVLTLVFVGAFQAGIWTSMIGAFLVVQVIVGLYVISRQRSWVTGLALLLSAGGLILAWPDLGDKEPSLVGRLGLAMILMASSLGILLWNHFRSLRGPDFDRRTQGQ